MTVPGPDLSPTRTRSLISGMLLLLTTVACRPAPPPEEQGGATAPTETSEPTPLTLKAIMQGLEADMVAGAHGLWIDDPGAVRAAAARIADHPHVGAGQMGVIQATLGEEFPDFARLDHAVHDAAVALTAAEGNAADLVPGYALIQEGCVACHSAFRPRVSEALNPPGG